MSTEEMVSAASEQLENTGVSDEISQKYLTFISDGLDFGIKASYISEILTNQHITILPLLPSYISCYQNSLTGGEFQERCCREYCCSFWHFLPGKELDTETVRR